jgi:signal transduction histidine kinase
VRAWLGSVVGAAGRSLVGALATAFAAAPPERRWPLRTRGRFTGRPRDVVWLFDAVLAAVALVTIYTAVVRADRPIAFGVWVVTLWGVAVVSGLAEGDAAVLPPEGWLAVAGLLSAPVVLGHNVRIRRGTQRELAEEQRRSETARAGHAVLEERARIAREFHDVVAHHMTLIAIQAEAAPLRSTGDAAALAADLASIRATSLAALTETRRILGVLRDDQTPTGVFVPTPGLAELDELACG